MAPSIRWVAPYGGRGQCVRLSVRPSYGWIEWRPKLQVWDAIVTLHDYGPYKFITASVLRTDDLFAAISFIRQPWRKEFAGRHFAGQKFHRPAVRWQEQPLAVPPAEPAH